MKKVMLALILLSLFSGLGFAQKAKDPPRNEAPRADAPRQEAPKLSQEAAMKKAGFSNDHIATVTELLNNREKEIRTIIADSRLIDAQVTRLLVEDKPDLKEVENQLNKAAALQIKIRMIRIRLELEIRSLVGDAKWAEYKKMSRDNKAD
jgi:hypothetical protein